MTHTLVSTRKMGRICTASVLAAAAWLAVLEAPAPSFAQQASTSAKLPLQPVGLRHGRAGFGPVTTAPYCPDCQPEYSAAEATPGMPAEGATQPAPDLSQYQEPSTGDMGGGEPTASNFGFANTLGDNFGGTTGNNVTFRLDSLRVDTDFYSTLPASPSPIFHLTRFSDTPVPFFVTDPALNTTLATTGIAGFETTQSEQVAVAAMSLFGRAPILNRSEYEALAQAAFVSRNGDVGTTTFDAANSSVGIVTPFPIPSFIDLNDNHIQDPGEYSVLGDSTSAFIDLNNNGIDDPSDPTYPSPVFLNQTYTYDYLVSANLPSPGTGGRVGRSKLSENSNPVPRDRIFFNYSGFYGVDFGFDSDVHRFTPGFEKTFNGGWSSLEVRFPMASAVTSDVVVGNGVSNSSDTQFGNLTMYFKTILHDSRALVVSGGVGFAFPTADDSRLSLENGDTLIEIQNDAVHVLPFVGFGYAPGQHFFLEGFAQFDIDCNGNPVRVTDFNDGLDHIGIANDADYMFLSLAMGYWTTRLPDRFVTRMSPMLELHYNDPLQDTDIISSDFLQIGTLDSDFETFNIVVGMVFDIHDGGSTLHLGYCDSLFDGDHDQFDSELRILWNTFF